AGSAGCAGWTAPAGATPVAGIPPASGGRASAPEGERPSSSGGSASANAPPATWRRNVRGLYSPGATTREQYREIDHVRARGTGHDEVAERGQEAVRVAGGQEGGRR